MSMVELQIISDNYRCKIRLERRITYLRGNSGVRKSTLVNYILLGDSAGDAVNVTCDKRLAVIQDIDSNERFRHEKNTLFILDDPIETRFSNSNIEEMLIENDSYMLIISRVDSLPGAVLEMKAEGIEHYCVEF